MTTGVHYYVCSPHASLGMKGRIFVTLGLGISNPETVTGKVNIYPNPTNGKFSIRYQFPGLIGSTTQGIKVNIYDVLGKKIITQTGLQPQTEYEFDLTSYPEGIYFLILVESKKTTTVKIVKK
jgi:hypothetical protein